MSAKRRIVAADAPLPAVVFGAFDRHNLGDLLLAHVAQALLGDRELVFAGLADRDLRPLGGHRVHALAALAARWRHGPALLWHAGGELLGCRAWQAALMLMDPAEAPAAAAYWQRRAVARTAWARRMLGTGARTPYAVARERFPAAVRIVHAGVGGVALARAPQPVQAELRATLGSADAVAVRDERTLAWMQSQRIAARLVPDPAVLVGELFGRRIAWHAARGEPARLRAAFPRGWIVLQCSADFGDDATLDTLAAALAPAAAAHGLGIVPFLAGTAPWHDDAGVLRRLAARLATRGVHLVESRQLWDLCAVVAGARACVASSLHARLVAAAHARPRITLAPPAREGALKQRAVIGAWDAAPLPGAPMPGVVGVGALAPALDGLLARDTPLRRAADAARAAALAARCRRDLESLLTDADR
ncbi:MAG: polysaccharide pyruvyl transferase family protein [Burkholderiales bacterium]|nr:polysaccharide pyruvyl transferase family protein [Burkholderiales bacterium]